MSDLPDWLPNIITLSEFRGVWQDYLKAIYEIFHQNFIRTNVTFRGNKVILKTYPKDQEKEASFWHSISEGTKESDRTIDLRRCERIPWIKAIITHADRETNLPENKKDLRVWKQVRKNQIGYALALSSFEYIIILRKRKSHLILWTTFLVSMDRQKKKYRKEYESFINAETAL